MAENRLQLPTGIQFGTILADPPWSVDSKGYEHTRHRRRRLHYDRMEVEEICAIPVNEITTDDAHLWLWTTNPHLEKALEVVKAWGFHYNTLVTWPKSKLGLGWWLRSRTEHIICASKSRELRRNPGSWSTLLDGDYKGHSIKPDSQYEMIEALSPGPRLELFKRDDQDREGWTRLGSDGVPEDPFGQLSKHPVAVSDPGDGLVRGVAGFEATEGRDAFWLKKEITYVPVTVLAQNKRKVQIEIQDNGNTAKKWVSIDNLRGEKIA